MKSVIDEASFSRDSPSKMVRNRFGPAPAKHKRSLTCASIIQTMHVLYGWSCCCAVLCWAVLGVWCAVLCCTVLSGGGLGWAGLGWAGLGWARLGWAGLGWAGLGWAGLGWAGLGGVCWAAMPLCTAML